VRVYVCAAGRCGECAGALCVAGGGSRRAVGGFGDPEKYPSGEL
jgi:hypothetical protein